MSMFHNFKVFYKLRVKKDNLKNNATIKISEIWKVRIYVL